jgi:hypothetical protein
MKGIETEARVASGAAGSLGDGIDGVISKSKRPLERMIFRDIAMSAMASSGAVGGTTEAMRGLDVGLMTLGRGVMMFSGSAGLAVLGIVAFIDIISKLKKSSENTAETIKKQTTELMNQSIAASGAADSLKKLGVISAQTYSELVNRSSDLQTQTMDKIKKISSDTAVEIARVRGEMERETKSSTDMVRGSEKMDSATQAYIHTAAQAVNNEGQRAAKIKDLNTQLDKLTATQDAANAILNKEKVSDDADKNAIELKKILFDQMEKTMQKEGQYQSLQLQEIQLSKQLDSDMSFYIAALKAGDQAKIDSAKKRVELDNEEISSNKRVLQEMKKNDQLLKAVAQDGANSIAAAFVVSNGEMVIDFKKTGAELIKYMANQVSAQLIISATRDLANPLTLPIGIAEMAAAGVVAGLGNAAASLMDSGGGSAGASSGSSSVSSQAGQSSSNNSSPINLTIQVKGGSVKDPLIIQSLAQGLKAFVQQNNGQVVATNLVSG